MQIHLTYLFKVCRGTIDDEYCVNTRPSNKHHTMGYTVSATVPHSLWSRIWLVRWGTELIEVLNNLQCVVFCNTVCLPAKMAFPGCFFPVLLEFEGAAAASFLRHVGYPGGLRLRSIFNLCSLSRQHQQRLYHRSKLTLEQRLFRLFGVRLYISTVTVRACTLKPTVKSRLHTTALLSLRTVATRHWGLS